VRKNLRMDTEALEFKTEVINIGAMPALVAMSGIGLAMARSRRRTGLAPARTQKPTHPEMDAPENDVRAEREISLVK
jgi:hypothetical protein